MGSQAVPSYTADPVVRGATAVVALQFVQQDVMTGELSLIYLANVRVDLVIVGPASAAVTWSTADGTLTLGARSIVSRALTPLQTQALALGTLTGFWRLTYESGSVEMFAQVSIPVEDPA